MVQIAELLHELSFALHSEFALKAMCMKRGQHLQTPPCRRQCLPLVPAQCGIGQGCCQGRGQSSQDEDQSFQETLTLLQAKAAAKAEAKAAKVEAKALRKAQEQRRLLEPGYEEQLTSMVIPTTAGEVAFAPSELGSATQEPSECLCVAAVRELSASLTACAVEVAFQSGLRAPRCAGAK